MGTVHPLNSPKVDVHVIPLDVQAKELEACRQLIDRDEQRRAARFRDERLAARWVAGRARLRELLAGYVRVAPTEISFREGRNGKPALNHPRQGIYFNLSHSEGLALVAISDDVEVGVDIEYERDLPTWPAVASHVFSRDELEKIGLAEPGDSQHLFYRCWTRKEAVIKATGEGLAANLKRITVSVGDDARILEYPDGDASGWKLLHIDPAPHYVGALATRSPVTPNVIVHRRSICSRPRRSSA